jgi:hypothetical protein
VIRARLVAVCVLACTGPALAADTFTEVDIFQNFAPSVAKIDFDGELFDGSRESSFGTAFLVSSDGLALTCNHVIPPQSNYRTSTLRARFRSLESVPVEGQVIWRDPDLDIALLRFTPPGNAAPLVVSATRAAGLVPGTPVMTLAFPIDLDLGVWGGKTNTKVPNRPRWVMDAVLNPGASGSPIFTNDGVIVGIAWGAAIRWMNGNASTPLEGIRYFVSSETIWNSLPPEQRALFSTSVTMPQGLAQASVLRVANTLDITQLVRPGNNGRRMFSIPLHAQPGYQIVGVNSNVFNVANMTDYTVVVAPDGSRAEARFALDGGTVGDPWRSWLKGTIQLEQKPIERRQ